jgi:hypothetical protein
MTHDQAAIETRHLIQTYGRKNHIMINTNTLRALLEGYEAAVKDLAIEASCETCKHGGDWDNCSFANASGCYVWRGPAPGREL